jgi:hypothetical protein
MSTQSRIFSRRVARCLFVSAALFVALPCSAQEARFTTNVESSNAVFAPVYAAAAPGCAADQVTVSFGGLLPSQECKTPGVWPIDNAVALAVKPVTRVCVGPTARDFTSVFVKGLGYFGWDDVYPGQCSDIYPIGQTLVALRIRG